MAEIDFASKPGVAAITAAATFDADSGATFETAWAMAIAASGALAATAPAICSAAAGTAFAAIAATSAAAVGIAAAILAATFATMALTVDSTAFPAAVTAGELAGAATGVVPEAACCPAAIDTIFPEESLLPTEPRVTVVIIFPPEKVTAKTVP